jgi:hypothetical protein
MVFDYKLDKVHLRHKSAQNNQDKIFDVHMEGEVNLLPFRRNNNSLALAWIDFQQ